MNGEGAPSGNTGAAGTPGSGTPTTTTTTGGTPGGTVGGGGVTDPGNGATCGKKTFGLARVPPDLLIVLDKSGSMNETSDGALCGLPGASCGPNAKWPQMTNAINQVVMKTDDQIRWGLKFFPEDTSCGVGMNTAVPIADKNAAKISSILSLVGPAGGTPTRIALAGATMYMASLTDSNPKYILLATDGMPNCAPGSKNSGGTVISNQTNPPNTGTGTNADDSQGAIQAVTDSAKNGIPVFVVGIGSVAGAQNTLTAMAIAGGRPQAAAPRYYPVSSTADLVSVLDTIGTSIGSCTFSLGTAPPDPTNIRVTADGTKIPHDSTHSNGWDYGTASTSVQLFGPWCDDAKAGKLKDVQALFGCPGVIVN